MIYLIGKLQNGESFGLIDSRFSPFFHIRSSDLEKVRPLISGTQFHLKESSRRCMDDEASWRIESPDKRQLDELANKLKKQKIRTYEADIKVDLQYLMEQGVRSSCQISGTWTKGQGVDRIYTNPQLNPSDAKVTLSTVILDLIFDNKILKAYSLSHLDKPDERRHDASEDEYSLLINFKASLLQMDPDVICAWEIQEKVFLPIQERFKFHGISFDLGRSREGQWFLDRQYRGRELSVIQGRQLLDIKELMNHTWERYEEPTPECIIPEVLNEDFPSPQASHSSQRAHLLAQLVKTKNLVDLSLRRSLLTGLSLERCWGSIASFEYLYIMELHKKNYLAPTLGVDRSLRDSHPGGLVMKPHAGIHENIFVFDFKSLYPSIIRSFNIDPLAYAQAQKTLKNEGPSDCLIRLPNGVSFQRQHSILPQTLERFFASRQAAKDDGDELASFVCKILMNSFFGVLGTSGCRFAQGPVVSSVSQTSHYLLRWVRSLLEDMNHKVLYGDTDSLFVDLGIRQELSFDEAQKIGSDLHHQINQKLAQHLKDDFGIESCLDLEFEKYYPTFFQPSMRGDDSKGRAKSYAALKSTPKGNELEIVGLEAVRRDWTELARQLQSDLLEKIFNQESADSIETFIQELINDLNKGSLDHLLTYRKRLTKPLESYTRTTPPHVKAARLLDKSPRIVFYLMTQEGPQAQSQITAAIDYQHYIDKQISPIVKTLSQHYDFSWKAAVLNQQDLFE